MKNENKMTTFQKLFLAALLIFTLSLLLQAVVIALRVFKVW